MFDDIDLDTAYYEIWRKYQDEMDDFLASLVHRDPRGRCGYVYVALMRFPQRQFVKVGRSKNPRERIKAISKSEVTMPYSITFLTEIWAEDMHAGEAALHEVLAPHRLDGEWFELSEALIESLMTIWFITGEGEHTRLHYYLPEGFDPPDYLRRRIDARCSFAEPHAETVDAWPG